jgi:hypothetical protein
LAGNSTKRLPDKALAKVGAGLSRLTHRFYPSRLGNDGTTGAIRSGQERAASLLALVLAMMGGQRFSANTGGEQ